MNRTTGALFIKFLLTLTAAFFAFRVVDENPWGWVFILALLGTFLNYLIGDLYVLRRTGNFFAAVMDGLLAGLTAYAVDRWSVNFDTTWGGLTLFASIILIAEYFFHRYLKHDHKVAP